MLDQQAIEAEFKKRQQEAEDDQVFRTVHIAGFGLDMPYEAIRDVCSGFGEVEQLRIDKDENNQVFALCEFKERGPAHVCKLQQQYLVRGTVLRFMEAKTMVDACTFAERTVQFEDPALNAIAMRSVLQHPGQLSEKIKLVRAAAEEILPSTLKSGGWTTSAKEPKDKKKGERRERRERKADVEEDEKDPNVQGDEENQEKEGDSGEVTKGKGRERKERRGERRRRRQGDDKDLQADDKLGEGNGDTRRRRRRSSIQQSKEPGAKPEEEEHRKGKRRRHRKSEKERKRRRRRHKSDDEKSGHDAECLSSESDGPIDLDEVEVVDNTELVVMGSSSSSSSSSTCTSRDGSPCCGQDDDGAIDLDSSGIVSLDEGAACAGPTAAPDSPSSS